MPVGSREPSESQKSKMAWEVVRFLVPLDPTWVGDIDFDTTGTYVRGTPFKHGACRHLRTPVVGASCLWVFRSPVWHPGAPRKDPREAKSIGGVEETPEN